MPKKDKDRLIAGITRTALQFEDTDIDRQLLQNLRMDKMSQEQLESLFHLVSNLSEKAAADRITSLIVTQTEAIRAYKQMQLIALPWDHNIRYNAAREVVARVDGTLGGYTDFREAGSLGWGYRVRYGEWGVSHTTGSQGVIRGRNAEERARKKADNILKELGFILLDS